MRSGVNGEFSRHSGRSRLLPSHVRVDEPSGRTHQESGFSASVASIENQVFECTAYAKKHLWEIAKEFVLADIAVSGASLERRHMLRSLIAAAEKRPRPFNRVLIADTARLTRNMEDCLYILKHFTDHDIRIVDISQGLDLSEIAARLGFPNTRARIPRHGKPSLTQ